MFDLTRITDMVGGWLGQQSGHVVSDLAGQLQDGNVTELISSTVGPEALDILAQHGIDVANLDASQLAGILSQLDANSPVAEILGAVLQRHGQS